VFLFKESEKVNCINLKPNSSQKVAM